MYLIPKRQYAAQYNAHGFYNNSQVVPINQRRRELSDAIYVKSDVQSFNAQYTINNMNRAGFVAVEIPADTLVDDPLRVDNSRFTIGEKPNGLNVNVNSNISGRYGALKISMPSQYGQLGSIKQFPISGGCIHPLSLQPGIKMSTPVLFSGDVYINRFTEKNSMLFFSGRCTDIYDQLFF